MCEGSLEKYIKNNKITEAISCKIMIQIINAIQYLHSCSPSIIHRDLKPANIMINENFEFKLIDFGISKMND